MNETTWRAGLGKLARAIRFPSRTAKAPTPPSAAPTEPGHHQDPYPGDFAGVPRISYDPNDDDDPDPGEVVWAWVPYEEDPSQGKDRPVLVIGRDGPHLLAVPFTSQDHDRDAAQEARAGRYWFHLGSGAWDPSGRPSDVRLDRVLRLEPTAVRREGATLDKTRFDALAAELRRTEPDR